MCVAANSPRTTAAPRDRCVPALPGGCDHLHTCGKIHLHAYPTPTVTASEGIQHVLGLFLQMHLHRHSGGLRKPTWVIWKVAFLGDSSILHAWGVGSDEDLQPLSSRKCNSGVPSPSWGFLLPSGFFMYKHWHVLREGGRGAPFAGDSRALWKSPAQMSCSGRD